MSKYEKVNQPAHYQGNGGLTVMQIIEAYDCNFAVGNVIKYMLRAGKKPGEEAMEDLSKALWYLQAEIDRRKPQAIGRVAINSRPAATVKGLEEMGRYYGHAGDAPKEVVCLDKDKDQ